MKQRFDLDKAAEAEVFGALALSENRQYRNTPATGTQFTTAQGRALSELVRSLVHIAREAGAEHKQVTVGSVSFELRENGAEEILSIRTGN
jgi:predicted amino acid dehydrogenase